MAQSAVTVRIDSETKSQFDELCEQFGMSANTAFNIFVKAVIRSRSIPFPIRGSKVEAPSALDLFMQQRWAAEASQEPEMTERGGKKISLKEGVTFAWMSEPTEL